MCKGILIRQDKTFKKMISVLILIKEYFAFRSGTGQKQKRSTGVSWKRGANGGSPDQDQNLRHIE